ncbi:MAG: DUF4263 domain-containing protein [Akkermansiaceae bacterium]|nr:DUF4263 domain-containing protein [Armatimonadota bacterium]
METEYVVEENSLFAAKMEDIPLTEEEDGSETGDDAGSVIQVLDPKGTTEGDTFRKVVKAKIVDNADGSARRVNFTLAVQRRHKLKEPWQDVAEFTTTNLKGGEQASIHLGAADSFALFKTLEDLYAISRPGGEPSGHKRAYVVRGKDQPAPISVEEIQSFLASGGEAVWEQVVGLGDKIPLAAALHKIYDVRKRVVEEFEAHVKAEDWDESDWQKFFTENDWIFGHGLAYKFMTVEQDQVHYGGTGMTGRGGEKGDYLLASKSRIKFTVLVEIKRPDTPLLRTAKQYRNGAFGVSEELAGGVGQVLSNCRAWVLEGSRQDKNRDALEADDIFTYEPKGILIIGNTSQLRGDRDKHKSFELFRRNLHNPEILTFDELLERARFLVDHGEVSDTHGAG